MKDLIWIDGLAKESAIKPIGGGDHSRFFIYPMTLRIPEEYYQNEMFMSALFSGVNRVSSKLLEDILYLKSNLSNLIEVPCYGVAVINSKRKKLKSLTKKSICGRIGFWNRTNLIFRNTDNPLERLKEEFNKSYVFYPNCSGKFENYEYLETWTEDHKYNVISVLLK